MTDHIDIDRDAMQSIGSGDTGAGRRLAWNSRPLVPCERPDHPLFKDLSGRRFGRLVVTGYAGRIGGSHAFWCDCECGERIATRGYNLTGGATLSCGCLRHERIVETKTTHGLAGTAEFRILNGMKNRCYNPNVKRFERYGGRGVTVCDRWRFGEDGKSGIECFIEDVGRRPSLRHSIDRYPDPDGNYEPGNVRWATAAEQEENKSGKRCLTLRGRTLTVHEWARETGLPIKEITRRHLRGWSDEKVLTQSLRRSASR